MIHLAAVIPPLADKVVGLAEEVNHQGSRHLIEVLEKHAPDAFLLYSSSIALYGDRLRDPLIRVSDLLPESYTDAYSRSKLRAEKAIAESRLDWSIFRLTAIMGNHKMSKLMFDMPLETSLEISTPEEAARAYVSAVTRREALRNKIFNLGGGIEKRTTYREYLGRSFQIFGLAPFDLPEEAFATEGYHCGYYEDGDQLEEILHFQEGDLEDHFEDVKKAFPLVQRVLAGLFKKRVKKKLLDQSEYYRAYASAQ